MKKAVKILSILALSAALLPSSHAATATKNITANAQLQPACTISATDLDFGWFRASASGTYASSGSMGVRCTKNTSYTISISTGNGTYAQRFMKHETTNDQFKYQLYTANYAGKVLGDGSAGTFTYTGTSQGNLEFLTISAVIDNAQYLTPGKYSDTLTMTITY